MCLQMFNCETDTSTDGSDRLRLPPLPPLCPSYRCEFVSSRRRRPPGPGVWDVCDGAQEGQPEVTFPPHFLVSTLVPFFSAFPFLLFPGQQPFTPVWVVAKGRLCGTVTRAWNALPWIIVIYSRPFLAFFWWVTEQRSLITAGFLR